LTPTGSGAKNRPLEALILTIIGASINVTVAIFNFITSKGDTEKWDKRAYRVTLLLAASVTAYGTWRGFLQSEENQWRQSDVQFQSEWSRISQHKERLQYERDLRAKTEQLAKQSEKIASLNQVIAGSVTGGDSFIYLMFTPQPQSNEAMLSLAHQGKYPVFDVSIELSDQDESDERLRALGLKDKSGSITLDQLIELTKRKATFNYPTIRPNMAMRVMDKWQLPVGKSVVRYRLAIFTRNGIFSQSINLHRVDGSWAQASQVFRSMGANKKSVLLYEWIDPRFPRDNQGKVVW